MKRTTLAVLVFFSITLFSPAVPEEKSKEKDPWKDIQVVEKPEPVPEKMEAGFDSISEKDAETHLRFLASDLLEGREAGSKAYDIAAQYAAGLMRLWGLKPAGDPGGKGKELSFLQQGEFKEITREGSSITLHYQEGGTRKSVTMNENIDFVNFSLSSEALSAPVVFLGCGISDKKLSFDEYRGIDVKGKAVLIFSGLPWEGEKKGAEKHDLKSRLSVLGKKGAAAILLVENKPGIPLFARRFGKDRKVNDEKPIIPLSRIWKRWQLLPGRPYNIAAKRLFINTSQQMADTILATAGLSVAGVKESYKKELKPLSHNLPGVFIDIENKVKTRVVKSANVLGMIEGSDPDLKKEAVIIGAHLDHLGKWEEYIFNGADDNGSGCAGVLGIARAFVENPVKPKRSVIFALWTAEEKGLLGSEYYVKHPVFPLEKTAAYLNLDMIGSRWDRERLQKRGKRWQLGMTPEVIDGLDLSKLAIASFDEGAQDIYDSIKSGNRYVGLTLCLKKRKQVVAGSDHIPFDDEDIPWGHFFAGVADTLHTTGDSVEKIDFEMVRDMSRLVYLAAFTLADK